MTSLLASQPWHWWIAVVLAASAVVLVIATILGYVWNVTRARYPRD